MRIHLKISGSREIIPFNHQHLLTGVIHKWIGRNDEHGNLSLYSFSRLERGEAIKSGLKFEGGTRLFFSNAFRFQTPSGLETLKGLKIN